jgi:hypothetical protein
LLFEARVEKGRLLVCAIDLERELSQRPGARQFRRSLLEYAASDGFQPKAQLGIAQVQALFSEVAAK